MKKLIIVGSARNNGNTNEVAARLAGYTNSDVLNLNDYTFSHFDYEHQNRNDEFIPLMREITANYDMLIFATPVYWYSMSGIMKMFFDRMTDLIKIEKDLGRQLKGKQMAVISSSNGDNLDDDFWLPFAKTAEYLGMGYLGGLHTISADVNEKAIKDFAEKISESKTVCKA